MKTGNALLSSLEFGLRVILLTSFDVVYRKVVDALESRFAHQCWGLWHSSGKVTCGNRTVSTVDLSAGGPRSDA